MDKSTSAELQLTTVKPSVKTTTIITTTKTTAKKSSVTNFMNVTNSITVDLTKNIVKNVLNSNENNVNGVGNPRNLRPNFDSINSNGIGISISIHHRIIAECFNASDDYIDYSNNIENDNDGGDDDENYREIIDLDSFDRITENSLSKSRKARHLDITTRRPFSRKKPEIKQLTTTRRPLSSHYRSDDVDTSQIVRKVRQSFTTRRPSHHYRMTTRKCFVSVFLIVFSCPSISFWFLFKSFGVCSLSMQNYAFVMWFLSILQKN